MKPTLYFPSIAIATTITIVGLSVPVLAASTWRSFSAPSSRFRVLFPGTPQQGSEVLNTAGGNVTIRRYLSKNNNAGYAVAHGTLPANLIKNAQDEQGFLEGARLGVARVLQGSVVSSGNLTFQGNPGRSLKLKLTSGDVAIARIFLVNRRDFYLTFVITNQEQNLQKSIQGFFNSFQFTNSSTVARGNTTNPPKPQPPRNLNNELQQAVCQQNWPQAIRVVDDIRKVVRDPKQQQELVSYRQTLARLAQTRSNIPQNLLTGCTTNSETQS